MALLLIYITIIILNAVGDGLNDRGTKGVGHAFEPLWITALIILPNFISTPAWHIQIIGYTLLNIAIFDLIYNKARGLKWSFVGTTSWWDIAIKKVPFGFMLFVRILCLITGISIILNS